MTSQTLLTTAAALLAHNKGLLAMDESTPTCNKRFAKLNIPQTEDTRRAYRELIVTTPNIADYISGAILFDETIRQRTSAGTPFIEILTQAGIIPGIKVDQGAKPLPFFPNEKITEGLDNLRARLAEYSKMGARFAKWRAVITIADNLPTPACLNTNAHALARYAALCQEADIVPIVEPEVLMDGNHSLARCAQVTEQAHHALFHQLFKQRVSLEGLLLKPNMILPGKDCPTQNSIDDVAHATVSLLLRTVPAAVPGIAFLSGGQSPQLASARLNAMNLTYKSRLPWALTYSYSRAIQQPALDLWKGNPQNIPAAQQALLKRAQLNHLARAAQYTPNLEN